MTKKDQPASRHDLKMSRPPSNDYGSLEQMVRGLLPLPKGCAARSRSGAADPGPGRRTAAGDHGAGHLARWLDQMAAAGYPGTLRARQILPLVIEYGQDITHTQVTSPLQISPLTDGLRVETGALTVTLNGSGPAPFA